MRRFDLANHRTLRLRIEHDAVGDPLDLFQMLAVVRHRQRIHPDGVFGATRQRARVWVPFWVMPA